jgi:hypothetical protein
MRFRRDAEFKDPLGAEAEVLSLTPTRHVEPSAKPRDLEQMLVLAVDIPGRQRVRTSCVSHVPWDAVPRVGQRLPVVVSASDPARVRIRWDLIASPTLMPPKMP